jgi:hypothetical protein
VQRADVVVLANQHGARLGADPLLPRDMAWGEGERTATLSDGARVTGTSVVAAGFAAFENCVVQYATNKDDPELPPQVVLHLLVLGGASKFKRSGLSVLMRFIHLVRALGVWLILETPVRNETYYSVHWGFRPMTGPAFRDAKNKYVVLGVSPQWEYVSHEQKARAANFVVLDVARPILPPVPAVDATPTFSRLCLQTLRPEVSAMVAALESVGWEAALLWRGRTTAALGGDSPPGHASEAATMDGVALAGDDASDGEAGSVGAAPSGRSTPVQG